MAKVASIAILACLLLLASTVAAEVCVYPDKKLKTCLKVDVALKARDCPSKSAQAGGELPDSIADPLTSARSCLRFRFSKP